MINDATFIGYFLSFLTAFYLACLLGYVWWSRKGLSAGYLCILILSIAGTIEFYSKGTLRKMLLAGGSNHAEALYSWWWVGHVWVVFLLFIIVASSLTALLAFKKRRNGDWNGIDRRRHNWDGKERRLLDTNSA